MYKLGNSQQQDPSNKNSQKLLPWSGDVWSTILFLKDSTVAANKSKIQTFGCWRWRSLEFISFGNQMNRSCIKQRIIREKDQNYDNDIR